MLNHRCRSLTFPDQRRSPEKDSRKPRLVNLPLLKCNQGSGARPKLPESRRADAEECIAAVVQVRPNRCLTDLEADGEVEREFGDCRSQ